MSKTFKDTKASKSLKNKEIHKKRMLPYKRENKKYDETCQ